MEYSLNTITLNSCMFDYQSTYIFSDGCCLQMNTSCLACQLSRRGSPKAEYVLLRPSTASSLAITLPSLQPKNTRNAWIRDIDRSNDCRRLACWPPPPPNFASQVFHVILSISITSTFSSSLLEERVKESKSNLHSLFSYYLQWLLLLTAPKGFFNWFQKMPTFIPESTMSFTFLRNYNFKSVRGMQEACTQRTLMCILSTVL